MYRTRFVTYLPWSSLFYPSANNQVKKTIDTVCPNRSLVEPGSTSRKNTCYSKKKLE